MLAKTASNLLHGLDLAPHGSDAPLLEEFHGPARGGVFPKLLEILPQQVAPDTLKIVLEQLGQLDRLPVGEVGPRRTKCSNSILTENRPGCTSCTTTRERRASRLGATEAGKGLHGNKTPVAQRLLYSSFPCTREPGQRRREPGPSRIARSGPLRAQYPTASSSRKQPNSNYSLPTNSAEDPHFGGLLFDWCKVW